MMRLEDLQRIGLREKQSRASKLKCYRGRMAATLFDLRGAWVRYLEAIDEARALDIACDGWFRRENAARLVVVRMARVRQLLQHVREYREMIRIGEAARSEMAPVLHGLRS